MIEIFSSKWTAVFWYASTVGRPTTSPLSRSSTPAPCRPSSPSSWAWPPVSSSHRPSSCYQQCSSSLSGFLFITGTCTCKPGYINLDSTRPVEASWTTLHRCILFLTQKIFLFSLLSLPATFGALYLTVWLGHRFKVSGTHTDIKDIKNIYVDNPKCGFWVAELLSSEATAVKAPKGEPA